MADAILSRPAAQPVPASISPHVPVIRLARGLASEGLTLRHEGGVLRIDLADALTGMAWFNGLMPSERALWLTRAGSACPADAWEAFKATMR